MQEHSADSQIPEKGPLAVLKESDATGEAHHLRYAADLHLRKAYKIPIKCLHFNIENGRYATLWGLLTKAYPGVHIDPTVERWEKEILKLLNGTWEDPGTTGASTRQERSFFDQLLEDIRDRGQERPGVVIENGAVMSGNRRLAALLTLSRLRPDVADYQFFNSFIVPGEHGMDKTDRWRLEISQQAGQGRLTRDYTPANRLLKIREGVQGFIESGHSEDKAIDAVAFDFGSVSKTIQADLESLRHIDEYLDAIGQPEAYWLINDKTEVFTEMLNIENALKTNGMSLKEKGELKKSLFNLIANGAANHDLMRKVRRAIGPQRPTTAGRQAAPSALKILIESSPEASELQKPMSKASQVKTKEIAQDFESQVQAADDAETPLIKARRAETNLLAVAQSLAPSGPKAPEIWSELELSLKKAQSYIKICFEQAEEFKESE